MGLEAFGYIDSLVSTNPASGDQRNDGDNHIRGIKSTLLSTFPNITGAVNATHTELNLLDGVTGALLNTGSPIAGQWVLMNSTTVSGSPSAVDFIDGTGGVVLSSAYDDYLIDYSGISHASSSNAKLRMQFSTNAGSSWDATPYSEALTASGSTATAAYATAFEVTGGQANTTLLTASNGMGLGGRIRMTRAVSAGTGTPTHMWLVSEFVGMDSSELARGGIVFGRAYGAITGLRLLWDSGSFGNTGRFKLFGRKV